MEVTMRAKDTLYGRYVFRSATEARWALFLDVLKIPYEYEPTIVPTRGGGGYCPDIYLPETSGGCWIEVEGGNPE